MRLMCGLRSRVRVDRRIYRTENNTVSPFDAGKSEVVEVFESLPGESMTYVVQTLNALILIVRVVAVPVAVIYALVLLRRVARNTARSSEHK